jgi:hypothetical protein
VTLGSSKAPWRLKANAHAKTPNLQLVALLKSGKTDGDTVNVDTSTEVDDPNTLRRPQQTRVKTQ